MTRLIANLVLVISTVTTAALAIRESSNHAAGAKYDSVLECSEASLRDRVTNLILSERSKSRFTTSVPIKCRQGFKPVDPKAQAKCLMGDWAIPPGFACVRDLPCKGLFKQWWSVRVLDCGPGQKQELYSHGMIARVECRIDADSERDGAPFNGSFQCIGGTWTSKTGNGCEYALCPPLPPLANGFFRIHGSRIAIASCDAGFHIEGENEVFCEDDSAGVWEWSSESPEWPTCARNDVSGSVSVRVVILVIFLGILVSAAGSLSTAV